MPTFSDYQSIFQLGAGLCLGFSGLVSLFQNPVERELKRLSLLEKRTRILPERFSISDENILSEIEDIRKRINDKIDQMIGSMNEHDDFYRLKVASFIASFSGFVLLIISSEISDSKIDLVSKTFAYLLLCYVPIAAFFIARDFKRSFNKYGKERVAIDSEYVSLVNRIFQTI